MSYSSLVKWVRKTQIEDVAEVICDLVERINILEEQTLDFSDPTPDDGYTNPYYLKTGTM
jgi:hypothetical protein